MYQFEISILFTYYNILKIVSISNVNAVFTPIPLIQYGQTRKHTTMSFNNIDIDIFGE